MLPKSSFSQAGEMVQQTKVLATKPEDLNSIPKPQVTEGENRLHFCWHVVF